MVGEPEPKHHSEERQKILAKHAVRACVRACVRVCVCTTAYSAASSCTAANFATFPVLWQPRLTALRGTQQYKEYQTRVLAR